MRECSDSVKVRKILQNHIICTLSVNEKINSFQHYKYLNFYTKKHIIKSEKKNNSLEQNSYKIY